MSASAAKVHDPVDVTPCAQIIEVRDHILAGTVADELGQVGEQADASPL